MTRSKKALMNSIAELSLEVVTAICGFILPRLILTKYGSAYNGIIASVSQFIGCIALLKSGIGSVTRAALYKPLAQNDSQKISEITNATLVFMRKIALIFLLGIMIFSVVYPFVIIDEFSWFFIFSLVIILSISTFCQYFFGLTYQMVIEADQKNYIISITSIITVVLNTIIASVLIILGAEIRIVKLVSAIVYVIPPIFYNIYVIRKYEISKDIEPNKKLISQRWDAFGHQVANFVNTNTDIIIITVTLGIKEVSVYSVYYLIGHAVQRMIKALSTGMSAAFGNMIAKNEKEILEKNFLTYEFFIFFITTIIITISSIMITPFIEIYVKGVSDVNYTRYIFGVLMCIAIYLMSIKLPYEQLIYAAGEFKKTKNASIIEAILNLVISFGLSFVLGINGVVIGTIIAILYRVMRNNNFICKNIIDKNPNRIFIKILYTVVCMGLTILICGIFPIQGVDNYFSWIIWAIVVSFISVIIATIGAITLFKNDFINLAKKCIGIYRRKK